MAAVNGFMAAVPQWPYLLTDLKLECLSAYRSAFHERMTRAQEAQLERRLTKLCDQEQENRKSNISPRLIICVN